MQESRMDFSLFYKLLPKYHCALHIRPINAVKVISVLSLYPPYALVVHALSCLQSDCYEKNRPTVIPRASITSTPCSCGICSQYSHLIDDRVWCKGTV